MSASDIILKISNIESYYGPIMAIRGISLEVPRGQIVTLLGANGAGKTTVLKTISGILDPQKGSIEFMGKPIIDVLVWMRMPGDVIFSVGAVLLAWFVLRHWIMPKVDPALDTTTAQDIKHSIQQDAL